MRCNNLIQLKSKLALFMAMLLVLPVLLLAQRSGTKDIKGKITDNTGLPLSGVSVVIKNVGTASVSNVNGVFSIKAKDGDVLVFSSVAFTKKEITIKEGASFDVILEASVTALNDVVVIGYGKSSR